MGQIKVWGYLILANLFWSGNLIFGSYVVDEMSPLWITFSRWLLALFLLMPIAYFVEKPNLQMIKKEWFPLLIMGLLGIIGYNIFLMAALEHTSATNAALVTALNPGIIVLFSFFILRETLTRIQVIGLIISILGVMVIITEGNLIAFIDTHYNLGDLMVIITVILWTFYSIIGRKLKTPPITLTAVSTLFSVLLLAPFALSEGISITSVSSMTIIGVLYMVIFPSVCSTVLWNISVREIGVSRPGVSMNLIPVFTAIAVVVLGGNITKEQIFGGILVFIGVYLTTGLFEKKMNSRKMKNQINL